MRKETIRFRGLVLAALLLATLAFSPDSQAQTYRGDFNYDGHFDISDVTLLINRVLTGGWEDVPQAERDTFTVKGVQFVMTYVEGGSFSLGDGITVTLPGFWIGQTEVTQKLWKAVMGSNPSNVKDDAMPVHSVSWQSCQAFMDSLSAMTGKQFRFPRSMEWTYAAQGGNRSNGYKYSGSDIGPLVAWYYNNAASPQRVALLTCNELGLYDMSGNVCEWCSETGPSGSGMRVIRGGDFYHELSHCLVTWVGEGADSGYWHIGLRLAM